ncbi:MAG: hypothetical protein VX427_07150 [Acidobacteriota bacterium]|nr:hypothetical protein [Acidobacteriota bacterium]
MKQHRYYFPRGVWVVIIVSLSLSAWLDVTSLPARQHHGAHAVGAGRVGSRTRCAAARSSTAWLTESTHWMIQGTRVLYGVAPTNGPKLLVSAGVMITVALVARAGDRRGDRRGSSS